MEKKIAAVITLASGLLSTAVIGLTNQPTTWVGAFSGGPVWESAGDTQTIYLTSDIEKTYDADQSTNAVFDGEVFIGLQKPFSNMVWGQIGLAIAVTGDAPLSGVIWDDGDPEFANYNYSYQIQHSHVALKGKFFLDSNFPVVPWISASLGVGFNNASQFESTPIISEAVPTPDFSSHTQTTFTYTLGAGIQKIVDLHWQMGIGYEFADWGRSSLGHANGQTSNSGLTLNHLYTNGVLFNVTYVS